MEGVRGLAVLLVFFVHYHSIFSSYVTRAPSVYVVSEFLGVIGNAGVDLFFVLSGYLIYGILLRKQTSYREFMARRIDRIYPAFLAVLAFYLAVYLIWPQISRVHGSALTKAVYILENVLLLPGFFKIEPIITVTWSLSYEFFFYLSIPLVVGLTKMWRWPKPARVVFFLGVWFSYLGFSFTASTSRVRLLMFISGILLYEALSSERLKRALTRRGEIGAILLFVASLVFTFAFQVRKEVFGFLPDANAGNTVLPGITTYQGPYKVIALGVSCFCFGLYCFGFEGFLKRAFSWRPIRYLGNMSYSYFLFHGVTLKALSVVAFTIIAPNGRLPLLLCLLLPICFAITWVTSTLLFALVEKPLSLERLPLSAYIRVLRANVQRLAVWRVRPIKAEP
jgi:peptidoglycan/LPS O-acetylase OafA/YrhL